MLALVLPDGLLASREGLLLVIFLVLTTLDQVVRLVAHFYARTYI